VSEPGHGVALWSTEAWRAEAVAWLDERLAAAGLRRTGPVEQPHLEEWATALRAPTSGGVVWLKAAGPGTAFEVGLYELLHEVVPRRVLEAIATDTDRGWMILPDGGPLLAEHPDPLEAMVAVLPQYAQLQLDLAPHVDRLLALGVADMRPAAMPARFDEALDAVGGYVERHGAAEERETLRRVAALRNNFTEWCERLGGMPGPASIDHNDLHGRNVFLRGHLEARFYDWGDSVVAHPFSSMLVALGVLGMRLEGGPDDPRVVRARDAYLEPFGDLAPHAELVEALELACQVGKVARALIWQRALVAMRGEAGEHAEAPLKSMASLLSESYLGVA
jgi:hypothetical protein